MHPILEQIQGTGNDKLEYNNEKASQLIFLLEKNVEEYLNRLELKHQLFWLPGFYRNAYRFWHHGVSTG